jgi:protein SCO1/2
MRAVRLIALGTVVSWGLAAAAPAIADEPPIIGNDKAALAISQAAVGRTLHDGRYVGTDGHSVRLASFRGKPLVVTLVYTGCNQSCPVVIESLHRSLKIAQDAFGVDAFAAVTVGFDTRHDTPERMRAFARERGAALANWHFLATDRATVNRLAADTGFVFRASAGGFSHVTQTTIVDAQGRVYRQIYGGGFEPTALVEPLKELVYGRRGNLTTLSGLVNRIRLFCTVYSPAADRYRFNYGIFVAMIIGFASLSGMAVVLVRAGLRAHAFKRSG